MEHFLDFILKLSPVIFAGIYLGRIESRLDANKQRIKALESIIFRKNDKER